MHTESEAAREGVALGNAVHLVHTVLKLLQGFLLLVRECAVQFLTIPGDRL